MTFETHEVRQSIKNVVKFLKKQLSSTKAFQQMPWYLVLGAKNAGKTHLIAQSALPFLAKSQFVQLTPEGVETQTGVNWWISPSAVLIDVPGSIVEKPQCASWTELLAQIRRYRSRCPVNGIMLIVDIPALQAGEANFNWINLQLQAVLQRFKQHLPIYLVLTKTDQIQGFHEYFDDLGKSERSQCCGLTLPLENKQNIPWVDLFSERFDQFMSHLHQRVLWRVHQEPDVTTRHLILNFPHQLQALKESLKRLIYQLNTLKGHSQLRGVYLTSSLAHQPPAINLIAQTIEKNYALLPARSLPPPPKSQHAFFIKALFEQKIFPEAVLTQEILRTTSRWDNFLHWSVLGCAAVVLAALTLTLSHQYNQQTLHLAAANTALSHYRLLASNIQPLDQLLTALDALSLAHQNAKAAKLPWLLRFQLHKQASLADLTAQLYTHDLQTKLMPAVQTQIAELLQKGDISNSTQRYNLLKTYLMLGDPVHADKAFLHHWFTHEWQSPLMENPSFKKHWAAALQAPMPALPHDTQLVENTRAILNALPYKLLTSAIFQSETAPVFTADYLDTVDVHIKEALSIARNGNWILGRKTSDNLSESVMADAQNSLIDEYTDNYKAAWLKFLTGLPLKKFQSLNDLASHLQILSRKNSPLEKMLATVHQNTVLKNQPRNLVAAALARKLEPEFGALNQVSLPAIQSRLKNLEWQIRAITQSKNSAEKSLSTAQAMADLQKPDPIRDVIQYAHTLPQPLNQWLLSLASQSRDLILNQTWYYTRQQWQLQVLPLCRAAIEHHYPFDKSAAAEISLADFGRFFEKGGIFNQFFTLYLSSFVQTDQAIWRWKMIDGAALSQDAPFLSQFERAAVIQALYFNQKNQLLVPFSLTRDKNTYHYQWPLDDNSWSIFKFIDQGDLKSRADGKTYDLTVKGTSYVLMADAAPNPFGAGNLMAQFQCPD